MLTCKRCSSEVSDTEEKCSTCGWYAGAPNVRAAEADAGALNARYATARSKAKADGFELDVDNLEQDLKSACAVVNVSLDFLHQFITHSELIYASYSLSVGGQIRKAAKLSHDRHRRGVEGMLFGGYAEEIRYAALSLNGSGLNSWGPFAMKLREVSIAARASLLEDNSYNFIPKHGMDPGDELPAGYVATWQERHKLAVAKLSQFISAGTGKVEHSKLLLTNKGDRHLDEYIEVHIYGGFDNKAVESVKGKSRDVRGKFERAALSIVKDYLARENKVWIEE